MMKTPALSPASTISWQQSPSLGVSVCSKHGSVKIGQGLMEQGYRLFVSEELGRWLFVHLPNASPVKMNRKRRSSEAACSFSGFM
jgi:hypothetical protein